MGTKGGGWESAAKRLGATGGLSGFGLVAGAGGDGLGAGAGLGDNLLSLAKETDLGLVGGGDGLSVEDGSSCS